VNRARDEPVQPLRTRILEGENGVTHMHYRVQRRPSERRAFAIAIAPDASRILFVRPHRGDDTYYSIRTARLDGRDEELLAVTDEEDLNIRSLPVWKPAAARVG
jgi:hypothetical protein